MGSDEGADDVLRLMGLENGTSSPFDGGRALCSEATNSGEEGNSLIKPEDKRSTVKGSRNNKQKNLKVDSMDIACAIARSYEGGDNKARLMDLGNVIAALLGERIRNFLELPGDVVDRNKNADDIPRQVILDNRMAAPLREEERLLFIEVTGHSGEGNEIRKPRPLGRPESSVEKKNPAGGYQEFPGEVMNGNDGKDIVSLMGSENRVIDLSAEEDQVLPSEATGGEANHIIRSRLMGLVNAVAALFEEKDKALTVRDRLPGETLHANDADGNEALPGEVMHGNEGENGEATGRSREGNVPKHKPGNPKGSKSKKTLAGK
ncbi:hypothetical protein POTOM_042714 [Populus tomentosa]|uniref:Uncharacterized protein n=1 Tax=Populus tomentosa TaxID=118781 RepID=A0A8X8CGP4_POPTO|nr:hypothetical protein POTOM_042714 [Populus tomentosa]